MPQVKAIPDGYHSVQPYMMLKSCAEAIAFYTEAISAQKEKFRMPRPDGRIMHAEIQIGDSVIMMADEAPEMDAMSIEHFGGSPVSLFIYTGDCDAVYAAGLAGWSKEKQSRTRRSGPMATAWPGLSIHSHRVVDRHPHQRARDMKWRCDYQPRFLCASHVPGHVPGDYCSCSQTPPLPAGFCSWSPAVTATGRSSPDCSPGKAVCRLSSLSDPPWLTGTM